MQHLTKIFILILVFSSLSLSANLKDFIGDWGIDPIESPKANGQPAPNLTGIALDNARGMFVHFDGKTLTLNFMGIRKESQCSKVRVKANTLNMNCTANNKTDEMQLELINQKLHLKKKNDSMVMVFDAIPNDEIQKRIDKAKLAMQILYGAQ